MRKSEAKEIARNILQDSIAQAGYKLYEGEDYEDYFEDESISKARRVTCL